MSNSSHQKPFDHTHYIAALRCKQAEKGALKQLPPSIRARMTPLIEIPRTLKIDDESEEQTGKKPRRKKLVLQRGDKRISQVLDEVLRKTTRDIKAVWSTHSVWLDLQHLAPEWRLPNGQHPVEVIWNYARADQLFPPNPVPVVTLQADDAFLSAIHKILEQENVGIVLRLHRNDLENPRLAERVTTLLSRIGILSPQADLVVDFGCVGKNDFAIEWACYKIPNLDLWRTFSCIGSSFPENLTGMELGQNEFARHEWKAYETLMKSGKEIPRRPAFGDYATQYGIYTEPPTEATPTASIRYTASGKYIVMRGRSTKVGDKFFQFPANADLLRGHEEFRALLQDEQCFGDDYIEDHANRMLEIEEKGKGTGNTTTWLQASFNRHWWLTAKQISTLFDS